MWNIEMILVMLAVGSIAGFIAGLLGIGVLVFINSYLLQSGETTVQGVMWQFAALLVLYLAAATFAQIRLSKLGHQFVFELRTQLLKRIMDSHDAQIQLTGKPRLLASLSNDIRSISMAFARLPELALPLAPSAQSLNAVQRCGGES